MGHSGSLSYAMSPFIARATDFAIRETVCVAPPIHTDPACRKRRELRRRMQRLDSTRCEGLEERASTFQIAEKCH
jgi:hypothetical protein